MIFKYEISGGGVEPHLGMPIGRGKITALTWDDSSCGGE